MRQKAQSYLATIVYFGFVFCSFSIWSGVTFFSTEAYNEWRLLEVVILTLLTIYYFFIPNTFINYNKFSLLIFFIVLFGLLSTILNAHHITRAFRDWSLYTSIIIGCISLAHIIKFHPKYYNLTIYLLCIFPILFVITFLLESLFYLTLPINDKVPVVHTFTGQFNNPRVFSDTALPILFILIGFIKTQHSQLLIKTRKLQIFVLFSLATVFMFSGGRGSLISLIITMLFFYIFLPSLRIVLKKVTIVFFCSFILGMLFNIVLGDLNVNPSYARNDSSGRSLLIIQSIDYLKKNFLLGIGPAQFEHNGVPVSHPHNLFLQFFVEWGVISGFSLVLLLATTLLVYLNKAQNDDNPLKVFVFMSAFAFIVNCNFNGAHIYPSSQLYAVFIFANVIANYSFNTDLPIKKINPQHILTKLCLVLIIFLLLFTTYIALGCGNIITSQKYAFGPRFWSLDSIHSDKVCPPAHTFFNK